MLTLNITGYTESEALSLLYDGLVVRQEWVNAQIDRLKSQLGASPTPRRSHPAEIAPESPNPEKRKHKLSPDARARIAAAQKKRWRKHRRAEKEAAAVKPAKRSAKSKRTPKAPKSAPITTPAPEEIAMEA